MSFLTRPNGHRTAGKHHEVKRGAQVYCPGKNSYVERELAAGYYKTQ